MTEATTPTSSTSTPLPQSWVEKLLHQMLLSYGKKFTDMWGMTTTDELVAHWAEKLAGFSGAELARGVNALETRDWPPTLPEFKRMCRPVADATLAYYEALAGVAERVAGKPGKWSHPAIYWAAMPLTFELQNQTYSQVKARWETAYAEQLDRGQWEPIPAPALRLAAQAGALLPPPTEQQAAQALSRLRAAMPLKTADSQIDHRRWAKRILEREKRGDKKLTLIQVQFAREALGVLPESKPK